MNENILSEAKISNKSKLQLIELIGTNKINSYLIKLWININNTKCYINLQSCDDFIESLKYYQEYGGFI